MLDLFRDGGWAMYPITVLLILGVTIAIERVYNLSRAAIDANEFFGRLEEVLKQGGQQQAAELCSETRGPVASVIHAGLLRLDRGIDHVEKTIENAGAVEMAFLERGMLWLSTVANLAPMVGFLGTVSGMINAFQTIAGSGKQGVDPSALADDIGVALFTTAIGLTVAIPMTVMGAMVSVRIGKLSDGVQEQVGRFVDDLDAIRASGKGA